MELGRGEAGTTYCLWSDTSKPPPCHTETDVGSEYWAAVARTVDAYVNGLRAIRFPEVAAAEAAAAIDDASTLLRRGLEAAAASVDTYPTLAAAARAASETESQSRQALKNALGLPVGP